MNTFERWLFALVGVAVFIVFGIAFGASYYEMKAFNRHSETKASYSDAFFANLRIIAD